MKTLTRILLPVAVLCGFALAASATILVNDTWIDATDDDPIAPTYSEYFSDGDLDGDIESAWYQGGAGTLNPVAAGGPLRGDLGVGGTSSGSWTTYFTPEATPISLVDPGNQLKITWVFTPRTVNVLNTSQNFRLAVVNSPSASRLTAPGSPGTAAYTGYSMWMNMGQTLGNSSPFHLKEFVGASGALLSGSSAWGADGVGGATIGLANGATSGNDGYDSDTSYTFLMTLTRNASSGLDIVATMTGGTLDGDGVASVTYTDPTPNGGSFTFDTFSLRPSGATTTAEMFDTTLFKVELIPEPSTFALFALGFLGLALRRRMAR